LVGANADYVVGGVCRQLRNLQHHPRAPQLLSALLREGGVSAALLPLLAEPLRAALSVSMLGQERKLITKGIQKTLGASNQTAFFRTYPVSLGDTCVISVLVRD
jgi:hypothetical protein